MENENNKNKYWFFGSKLNSVLLLILIILMVIALKWMYQQRSSNGSQQEVKTDLSVENLEINKEVKTDFGVVTIPSGWKSTQGCYKESYTIAPESVPSTPDISANEVKNLCDNYVSIGQYSTCQYPITLGYYCRDSKVGALMTINPKLKIIVDSLYKELK